MNWALGWACNLKDIFVRFPYEKYPSLNRLHQKNKKLALIKRVFIEGMRIILTDIIENNVTFKIPPIGYYGGEIHMEAIRDEDFKQARKNGKFKKIDFIESLFTGYQMYLYIHGKRDNFLHRRKFPIYYYKELRDKLIENTNKGMSYC